MDTDNQQNRQASAVQATRQSPRNYNFLLRMSRRMGGIATRSSFVQDVRHFMRQEITYNTPVHWWGTGMARLRGESPQAGSVEAEQQKLDKTNKPDKTSSQSQDKAKKEEDLKKIVAQSHEVLMAVNTVFPITLFSDTVMVDRTKVTITRRDFFFTSDVMSIRIEDVLNVSAMVGPLFGSLTVASRVMSTVDHFQIKHLWRNDAIRLKHIIQGYVIAQHNNIDTAHLKKNKMIETLLELGHDSSQ